MIYLDNSATTYPKPQSVITSIMEGFIKYGANGGRSGHSFSLKTAMKIAEIRQSICDFVNAESLENVIFTSGCTDALNLAILGTCQKGGHIICTSNCHNSTLRPIFELKNKGLIDVSVAEPKYSDKLTLNDILPHIKPNTYLVCVNHISNVDGMETDIVEIGKYCYEKCITFMVDVAQSLGHKEVNMLKWHIDLLAIAGHKGLYGPTGVGALVFSSKTKIRPIKFGGTGTDSINLLQPKIAPECFEVGTLPIPAIIGLGAGIDFVRQNQTQINNKLDDYTTYINYELSKIEGVKVYTHPDNANGVLSFNIKKMPSTSVATLLDKKFGIMVRSGLHCSPLKHKSLGTLEQGTVRVSISYFTKFSYLEKLIKAVKFIAKHNEI